MKKIILTTTLLGLFSTSVLSMTANAATATTDGKVKFVINEDEVGNVIKPNPNSEDPADHDYIVPEGGGSTAGPLRIQYVPDLDFGIKKGVSAAKIVAFVKPTQYTPATLLPEGVTNSHTVAGNMVPFVQVTDNRGLSKEEFLNGNGWELTVKATQFSTIAKEGNAAHELTGSKIFLKGNKLTTTIGSTELAKTLVAGIEIDPLAEDAGLIPYDGTTLSVLKTHKELTANTNGHQVSNVFSDDYTKEAKPGVTEDIESVQFVKPAGIAPQAGKDYLATLTWTLTDGL